jgi:Sec-independent protein translocase protein TatA
MKKDLKILGKDNFWHLALIMLVVLVIILGTVLS